jgi:hypothetical protein
MNQADSFDVRFNEFRESIRRIAEESAREGEKHLEQDEHSLELAFHEGETGSFELALDYLNEIAEKSPSIPANSIEEAYVGLLLSYKRMKGNLSALERILKTMQETFELPREEELERGRGEPEARTK